MDLKCLIVYCSDGISAALHGSSLFDACTAGLTLTPLFFDVHLSPKL